MIIGFVGTPGSGKSYEAVKKILDNLKKGRKIYTNIEGICEPEQIEAIKAYTSLSDYEIWQQLVFLEDKKCKEFLKYAVKGSLIVIDEVHKLFSNRNWQTDQNKEFIEWASTHRHFGFDVVLITQDIEKIDKHARSLVEWTYYYRKVNQFGSLIKNKYTVYAYQGDDHNGKPLSQSNKTYDQQVFPCYKSFDSADIKELSIMSHVNVLKHPLFYSIPVVFVLLVFLISRSSMAHGDLFGAKKIMQTGIGKTEAVKVVNPAVPFSPGQTSPGQPAPGQSVTPNSHNTVVESNLKKDEPEPDFQPDYTQQVKAFYLSNGKILYSNITEAGLILPKDVVVVKSQKL